MNPTYRSAGELARLVRDGETTAEALLEHFLDRVQRFNDEINAVVVLDADNARRRAREADAALARGELWGPLHGVPMTIKETFELQGLPTTAGSPALKEHRSEINAAAARRLLDAGAIIFGKTNVPLYAGDLQSYNAIYGQTDNPWNPERTCGGSSGGAAAALAAGLTPLELGSDIGGSIRTPAHFCGVCGHKPSYGLVSGRGHVPGPPGSLSRADIAVMGPLSRNVDDLEMALDILAGPDPEDAGAWTLSLPDARHGNLKDFRVAAWLDDPACPVDSSMLALLEDLIARLGDAGVPVDTRARPDGISLAASHDVYYQLLTAAMSAGLPTAVFSEMRELAATTAPDDRHYGVLFARGATQTHAQWLKASEKRQHMRRAWARFFESFDVLLCPVVHTPAFPHDHSLPMYERTLTVNGHARPYMDVLVWAGLSGVVYLPSTVVPVGHTPDGLPVGVQIVGPFLEDRTTLAFARQVERLVGGFRAPPGYA